MASIPSPGNAAIATGLIWLSATLSFILFDPTRGSQAQEVFYNAVAAAPFMYQLPRVLLALVQAKAKARSRAARG